ILQDLGFTSSPLVRIGGMALDSLVESVTTYRLRPTWQHLYASPFIFFYLAVFATWTSWGFDEHYELGCIGMAAVGLLQALCFLFGHWFVGVQAFMTCSYESDPKKASWVKVVPTPNNGWAELLPVRHSKMNDNSKLWFEFQKVVYAFNTDRKEFETVVFDTRRSMKYYQSAQGFQTDEELVNARYSLGDNKMEMVIPQFIDMFKERATAPFFVFQVFCVGLWCLEDMWYYSLFTLAMLMTFEATLVKQQLKNMAEIRNMGNKTYQIYCFRNRKWNRVNSNELVPGDIVSIGRSQEGQTIPCDLILLRGPCIVDESMLTGESVPQMKEPIEGVEGHRDFDIDMDSRLHVISGGTKVVQHTPPGKNEAGMKSPDNGCICYVLRTGFNTSQGKLLRTIMFGVKRVTANNLETAAFILFLLIFAVAAAAYLWLKGSEDPNRSKYKLFLECTLILTSVIPPELPIELSLAVNNSLVALQKLGVFCTEPFRIPFAGKIDICCFDKTGTLTTDNLVVEGIATGDGEDDSVTIVKTASENLEGVQVLACCHSLVRFDEELVGDPLEKACLQWIDFSLTKSDTVIPNTNRKDILPLRIAHRFHFSSAMKRMTTIAGYIPHGTNEPKYVVAVKGAPEVLKSMYASVPDDYEETYTKLTRQGARVLALGLRQVGSLTPQEIRDSKREHWEKELKFAGFVVISCPLKPDTKAMIKEIIDSSHRVVMITGDNPLTACHVAKVLRFTSKRKPTLILDAPHENGGYWGWRSVCGEIECEVEPNSLERTKFFKDHEFCITGSALTHLLVHHRPFYLQLVVHVAVFARMAPKQKEQVINDLKHLGKTTLMCGDGTNDVGALKHANVGVALLSHPFDATKHAKKTEGEKKAPTPEKNDTRKAAAVVPQGGRRSDAPAGARQRPQGGPAPLQKRLDDMMKEIEEEEKAQVVRLGDASIAAPFTSKYTSIQSICHVIKQGRCTLVTTLQMFKILALNALISAYSLSVLYLDGVKFSDTQATIQGLLLAACFLFVSRAKPLDTLSRQRPMANIFNAYTLLTVSGQFAIHFTCLLTLVGAAHAADPRTDPIDLEAKFTPNMLNTTVYIISMALQVCTFAVNYRGRPFMESLLEHRAMLYSLLASGFAVFSLAWGASDDMIRQFELVVLPPELRDMVVKYVAADLVGCYALDRSLNFLLGDMF
ncbi:hypothetical protein PENTCL1PPCAC_16627, partial [Pristionchus entomophagus]